MGAHLCGVQAPSWACAQARAQPERIAIGYGFGYGDVDGGVHWGIGFYLRT